MDLWLSSPTAAPGEWVQAVVRTTNLRDTTAWSWSGECLTSGTRVAVDLAEIIPPGEPQTGNAAVFKQQALRDRRVDQSSFAPWRSTDDWYASTNSGYAFVECMVAPGPLRLKAGATRTERFAWYPYYSFDGEDWLQPLPPGTVTVTASWPYLGRGERPSMSARRASRTMKPVTATTELEVTGDGPGTPSLPELIDIALADPEFRAWVELSPGRERWCRWCVSVTGWPGPTFVPHLYLSHLGDTRPNGVLTLELDQQQSRGIITMDPWTGEVIDVQFLGGAGTPVTNGVPAPTSSSGSQAALDPAAVQAEHPGSACQPPTPSASIAGQDRSDESAVAGSIDPLAWSEGRWRSTPRGPFGTAYAPAVWTGSRLLVVDRDTGRTATYRPDRDRWREVTTAPRRVEPDAPFVWTGTELVISDMSREASSIGGLAYDPGKGRWRELAPLPFEAFDRDHSITAAIWTGTHVVVAEGLGLIAAYDPVADCWTELGRVPSEQGFVWHLYLDGPRLLVESRTPDDVVEMRSFDPASGDWSEPVTAPLDRSAAEAGGVWSDGSLVYVTWRDASEYEGAANATFDPSTMSWSVFEHDCTTRASRSIEAGGLLVSSDGRRVLDPATLMCIEMPKPPRRLNGTEATVWTGSELIAWSGIRSLPEPPRRGGLVFEPKERTE